MKKLTWFFIIFGLVYFLESIGGFYMSSAIVFIEKQFQIPSELSGTIVSANDFAYIPLVIFTSYFGGKGNRARWIGAGCVLISIANFMISSSNFLFPVEVANTTMNDVPTILHHQIQRDLISTGDQSDDHIWLDNLTKQIDPTNLVVRSYEGDSKRDLLQKYLTFCHENGESAICSKLEYYLKGRTNVTENEMVHVRLLTSLPYAFCHSILNTIRQHEQVEKCQQNHSSMGPFLMIFCGLLVLGVGRTMPFSLGLPLMDDNVKRNNLPLYYAFMFFVKILGPVIGLLVGGQLNKIYYNFNPPHGLTPLDPMWIGCWWLGFLIFGTLLIGPSIVLYCFPADSLEETDENGKQKGLALVDRHVKTDENGDVIMPETAGEKVKDFFSTIGQLLKNKIFVGALCGRIVDVLAFKGYFIFLSKYLEIQFGVPQFRIQKYLAGTGTVGFAFGVLIGSLSMKKLKLEGRRAAAWVAVCSLVAASLSFINGTVGCKSVIGHIGDQARLNNNNFISCRADCNCDGAPFYPVCNKNGDVFYSPCHAGCPLGWKNYSIFDPNQSKEDVVIFEHCDCTNDFTEEVSRAYCQIDECESKFKTFFFNQIFTATFGGLAVVPGMLIVLRSVPPEHRSVSLGFNGFLVSLLATLPSPIIWGKVFDMCCIMWQSKCDVVGSCSIYDTDQLRIRLHLIYGGLRLFSLLSDIWVFFWAKGLKLLETDDDEKEKVDAKNPRKESIMQDAARAVETAAQEVEQLLEKREL